MPKDLEISYLIDFYGDVLTAKQQDVLLQYYNDDLSLAEIAENFGITRQGVRDSIKRGEGILLDLEAKVGFATRYRSMQKKLELLGQLVQDTEFRNNELYQPSAEISRNVDQMKRIIADLGD